jgi:hypothetical protein
MPETIISAVDNLLEIFKTNGFNKYAFELESFTQNNPNSAQGNRFQKPADQQSANTPKKDTYPLIALHKIFSYIENNPSFKSLPKKIVNGILKIKKMSGGFSRYAFDREAFFDNEKDPVTDLKKFLQKFYQTSHKDMSPAVADAVNTLDTIVDQELSKRPKKKNIFEKGMDVARGVAEKGKDLAKGVSEKAQQFQKGFEDHQKMKDEQKTYDMMRNFEEKQVITDREQSALLNLKNNLLNSNTYHTIFYKLPKDIIQELENIGLGLEDLKNMATSKVACHVNNTLMYYFKSLEAYSSKELSMGKKEEKEHADVYNTFQKALKKKNVKIPMNINEFAVQVAKAHLKEDPKYYTKLKKTFKEAMDFSSISGLITPDGKLDERALARVIRLAIAAELDAVDLYELIVDAAKDSNIVRKVLQDIADEEKIHASELNELLNLIDTDNPKFVEEGKKEVEGLIK